MTREPFSDLPPGKRRARLFVFVLLIGLPLGSVVWGFGLVAILAVTGAI